MSIGSISEPLYGVVLCWLAFAGIFIFRKRPPVQMETRRDKSARWPIAMQGVAYGIVWGIERKPGTPLFAAGLNLAIGIVAVGLAVASVWLVWISVRILGKQWAVATRLVQGHALITEGPYRFVRNPIYTGMFGMLIATGLVVSHWIGLVTGLVVFLAGTILRVRIEERMLRSQFGPQFDEYCRKVSSLIPGVW